MSMFTSVVIPIIACVGVGAVAGVYVAALYRRNLRSDELEKRMKEEAKHVRISAPPLAPITVGRPRPTPVHSGYRATHAQINSTREGEDEFLLKQMLLYDALTPDPVDRPSTDHCTPSRHEPTFDSSPSSSSDYSSSSSCDSSSSSYDSGSSSSGSFD